MKPRRSKRDRTRKPGAGRAGRAAPPSKTYDDIPPALRNFFGTREMFRRLGFAAKDLYIELTMNPDAPADHLAVFMTLKTMGKEFRVVVGYWPKSGTAELEEQYRQLCALLNAGDIPEADFDRMRRESMEQLGNMDLMVALMNRGIRPPRTRRIQTPHGEVVVDFDVPCAFCKGTVLCARKIADDEPIIIHGMPMCSTFENMGPTEFVAAMDKQAQKRVN